MFGFMPPGNHGVAAYQQAMRELREKYRAEFDTLLKHFNHVARMDALGRNADPANYEPALKTTPYNAAMAHLRDKRHRKEFNERKAAIKAELEGEVDNTIEALRKEFFTPKESTDCEGCRDKPYLDHISDEEHVRNDICPCSDPGWTHSPTLHEQAPRPVADDSAMIPIANYSMALDEIYLLRAALADEARILDAHLDFKTFPLSRRKVAEQQVLRMRGMARGLFEESVREHFDPKGALRSAGADECMTRSQWEQQRHLTGESA